MSGSGQWLGDVSIDTTNIYPESDLEMKTKAWGCAKRSFREIENVDGTIPTCSRSWLNYNQPYVTFGVCQYTARGWASHRFEDNTMCAITAITGNMTCILKCRTQSYSFPPRF